MAACSRLWVVISSVPASTRSHPTRPSQGRILQPAGRRVPNLIGRKVARDDAVKHSYVIVHSRVISVGGRTQESATRLPTIKKPINVLNQEQKSKDALMDSPPRKVDVSLPPPLPEVLLKPVITKAMAHDGQAVEGATDHHKSGHWSGTVLENTTKTTNDLTSNKQRLYFNITIARNRLVFPKVKILRGELKIYKYLEQNTNLHQKQRPANLQLVKIYQLLKPAIERKEFQLHFLGSKVITSNYERAETFDIRKTVEYWINYPQENYGLELELLPRFSSHKHNDEDKVTIEAELEIEIQKVFKEVRTRRESHTEDCQRNQIQCCRRSLHVSFEEIGWSDWIRAPLSYNAFYCDGTCPQKYKLATMHTLIKSKMNHLSNGAIPAPCCVPASYEPLTLLHFNSNNKLTLTAFDDMVVSRCHCS
ncbi:bone morphogenetic protein 2-like [Carcharodon carcharias]|uniref:bone morphogenetic protein 2-like n=1 Tax=Carcharodon carcharias TaxID=13397 RepID=UPI001B7D9A77|nr:bone morphogenetic protein 2-like [Carcharodon carcharias]